jgi:hypothetical protein
MTTPIKLATPRPPLTYAAGAGAKRILVNGETITLAKAALIDARDITTVSARGCTGLTTLELPAATWVAASGCTGLTTLKLPAATTVDASDCTGLTTLELPAAAWVYASGCTGAAIIFVGSDHRGYEFRGLFVCGVWRVSAGCRYFTLPEARTHWSRNSECLALVEKIAAEIDNREAV